MLIRKITRADIPAIGEIYVQAFDHYPDSIKFYKLEPYVQFCMDNGYAFVAEGSSEIKGFIIGYERPSIINGKITHRIISSPPGKSESRLC